MNDTEFWHGGPPEPVLSETIKGSGRDVNTEVEEKTLDKRGLLSYYFAVRLKNEGSKKVLEETFLLSGYLTSETHSPTQSRK